MQMLYLILLIFNKRGGGVNFIPLEGPEDESKNGQKFDEVRYCLVKDFYCVKTSMEMEGSGRKVW